MSVLTTPDAPTATEARHRPPVRLTAVAAVTTLHSLVTSYGAYYFTFVFEDPQPVWWSYLFVGVFWALALSGATAAWCAVRGSERARRLLVAYCGLGLAWTAAKLVFWHETEAMVFGVVGLCVLLVARSRAARDWTS